MSSLVECSYFSNNHDYLDQWEAQLRSGVVEYFIPELAQIIESYVISSKAIEKMKRTFPSIELSKQIFDVFNFNYQEIVETMWTLPRVSRLPNSQYGYVYQMISSVVLVETKEGDPLSIAFLVQNMSRFRLEYLEFSRPTVPNPNRYTLIYHKFSTSDGKETSSYLKDKESTSFFDDQEGWERNLRILQAMGPTFQLCTFQDVSHRLVQNFDLDMI